MPTPALPDDEVAALPPLRPQWQRRLVAALFLAVTAVIVVFGSQWARDHVGAGRPWYVEDLAAVVTNGLPGVLLLPAYRRVGFRRRDVLFFALLPVWGLVIAPKVGYRLASLPYRDWPARPEEEPRRRRIPGTPYDVALS